MTRVPPRGELTPDESRLLDGVLPAAQARRLENQIAADPHRAEGLRRDREAAGLWRDDAQRTAADFVDDPDVLADRVLALTAQGPSRGERRHRLMTRLGLVGDGELADRTVMRYAAAAVVLMAIGIGGTWLVRANRATARTIAPEPTAQDHDVDEVLYDGLRQPVQTVQPRTSKPGEGTLRSSTGKRGPGKKDARKEDR